MPIALILILIIGLLPGLPLHAQDQHKPIVGTVSTSGIPLKVRKAPNMQAEIITKLENGAPIRVLSTANTWYSVQLEDGRKGYAFGKYIKMQDEYGVVATTEHTSLNVKESDLKGSPTIATLENGAQVQILAETAKGWYQIRLEDDTEGYVDRKYIQRQTTPSVDSPSKKTSFFEKLSPTTTQDSLITRSARVVTRGDVLRVRAKPNGKIINSVENQSIVEVMETQGDWYLIKLPDGSTGYAYSQYLVLLDAKDVIGYATVATNSQPLNVRETPEAGATVVAALPKGTQVEVLETKANWYKIRTADGIEGYAWARYLNYVPN